MSKEAVLDSLSFFSERIGDDVKTTCNWMREELEIDER